MKPNPRPTFAILVSVSALLSWSASCKSTPQRDGQREMRWSEQTIAGDPSLASAVRMVDTRFVEDGATRSAQFALDLASGSRRDVLVHVEWFDALGAPIEVRPQGWIPIELESGAPVAMRVAAPSGAARSFRLRFQRPEVVR